MEQWGKERNKGREGRRKEGRKEFL